MGFDFKTFAYNVDLFIEHGSMPTMADGLPPPPPLHMGPYGDIGRLQPQEIADVIAYIYHLNQK